ncbi:hypothetical protein BGZ65_001305 [Modicella reniformis]|uniref:PLP-dependent transferase n=1 Tax=Modicella reniformis TaxID=1440133 RepID=A0A9P6LT31_9FUNG|nr:hypothetical protein BGZ65_001305 [Modicella reniformis]
MALPDNPKTIARLLDRVAQHAAHKFEDLTDPQQRQTLPLQPFPSSAQLQQQQKAGAGGGGDGDRDHDDNVIDPITRSFLSLGLTQKGVGLEATAEELLSRIGPSLANSAGPRYFGLVTGGVTPAAFLADWLVTSYDQNTILHSPVAMSGYSVITEQAMKMVVDLFDLPREGIDGGEGQEEKTKIDDSKATAATTIAATTTTTAVVAKEESRYFRAMTTTGSTASNIVGMAVGRQWLGIHDRGTDYSQDGYDGQVVVLTNMAHATVWKAASILGIGRRQVVEIPGMGVAATVPNEKDNEGEGGDDNQQEFILEQEIKKWKENGKSVMVFLAFGEVNTNVSLEQKGEIRNMDNNNNNNNDNSHY